MQTRELQAQLPEFDLNQALKNEAFKSALVQGYSIQEAYIIYLYDIGNTQNRATIKAMLTIPQELTSLAIKRAEAGEMAQQQLLEREQ